LIKSKNQGELIVISGTTCAGKGTILKKLLERNEDLNLAISYTSRYMRDDEIDGINYYFVSQEEFENKIKNDEFLEYAKVRDIDYYGTPKREVLELLNDGKDVILEIDVQGAKIIKEKYPSTLLIFILPPSMKEIKARIIKRGKETKKQIIERFRAAYQEINEVNKYNYVVVNDDLEECVNKIDAIITANRCRVDRIEEIMVENQEEFMHELLMEEEFTNEKIDYENKKIYKL